MQGSTVERMRKRKRLEEPITNSKSDKLTRKYRRLNRAIKQGEYQESDTSDNDNNKGGCNEGCLRFDQ